MDFLEAHDTLQKALDDSSVYRATVTVNREALVALLDATAKLTTADSDNTDG